MLVGLYLRVSTQEQAKEGYSIGEQEERLRKYCEAMQWNIFKVYIDPGYSGGNTDRPGLQDLIKDVKAGEMDKVVVYKLDRLSRSQLDTLYLIEKVFLANDTDFVSMSENFDTSTPFGRAMIGILAVFAQLEREQIKERMGMGKEARAKEGKWGGGASVPIGYDYSIADDMLYINEYEQMQIRELRELFLKGTPLRSIEKIFREKGYKHKHGIWDPKSMKRVLRSKLYLGYIKYNDNWYPGIHEPTIDQETYDKIVAILDENVAAYAKLGLKSGVVTTYLGALLYCKHCGAKFAKDRQTQRGGRPPKTMYICNSRSRRVPKMVKDPNCKNKRWNMEELDNIVFEEIKKLDLNYIKKVRKDKLEKTDQLNKADILRKEIEKIDEQISRFMDLYGIGKFTIKQVSDKVDPLNEQKKGLVNELESLTASSAILTDEETIEIVKSFGDILERGNFQEIRTVIETLIYYIEIDNENVYIHWKFA